MKSVKFFLLLFLLRFFRNSGPYFKASQSPIQSQMPSSFFSFSLLVVALLQSLAVNALGNEVDDAVKVSGLKCEYRSKPMGIDVLKPQLMWTLEGANKRQSQSAYQILVASSEESLAKNQGDLWDTGKVETKNNGLSALYDGRPLVSGQEYHWKVRVWGGEGQQSEWGEPASWEMGLLTPEDWQGTWIDDGKPVPDKDEDFYKDDPAPYFRTEFNISKPVKRARFYIAGLGYNEPYLNGQRVGENELDSAWTTYSKRVLYSCYDVTSAIKSGENCLGVMVGNGWFNPLPLRMWGQLNLRNFLTVGRPRVIAQLNIEYRDGSRQTVSTDENWTTSPGPILRNSVYLGERYDARREQGGWCTPSFDDAEWLSAREVSASKTTLRSQAQPAIKRTNILQPIEITELKPGVFICDFGTNMAGRVRLKVSGAAGQKVKLRFGELLYPDGSLNVMTTVCGQIKEPGIGGPGAPAVAEQCDEYILRGEENGSVEEAYEPRFTFHAFRYVEITGFPGSPTKNVIEAVRLNSAVDTVGTFSCSNKLLNQIQEMCLATFPSNLVGVQSDCPGRERFAYGDDIACACEAHLYNYDMATFYAKTVRDFADAARPNGALTLLAPWTGHAIGGFDPGGSAFADVERNGANAGSGPLSGVLAHSLLLFKAYQVYGDRQLVEEQYPIARKSLEFVRKQAPQHIVATGLGDWSSVKPTETAIMDTALYYQHASLLAKLATIVGRNDDAVEYEALAAEIQSAFIKAFLEPVAAKVGFDTQAARASALYFGLVPKDKVQAVSESLVADVLEKNKGHLSTGIFGTKFLLDALTIHGRPEVAYTLINQTDFPGWGYMLQRGATTLWEVWDFSDNVYSHNHSMFGTISAWFFGSLGGIQPAHDAVGFDKIVLKPQVVPGLTWVTAKYRSVRGEIVSNWRLEGETFHWDIVIPPTASAIVYLPTGFAKNVTENSLAVDRVKEIKLISGKDEQPAYLVESGSYSFSSQSSLSGKSR